MTLLLLVSACGSPGAPGADSPDFEGVQWELAEGSVEGDEIAPPETHPITIMFEEGRVGGTASCNGYGGEYTIDGATLAVGTLAMTEMACSPPETMTAESLFTKALLRVESVTVTDGRLILSGDDTELVFAELPPVPDAELQGTVWVLDGLISG